MEYRVLGDVAVLRDGTPIELAAKPRALLALLLVHANRTVSTDRIIDELWDDTGRDRQNALWVVISRLRGLLEPDRPKRTDGTILVTRPPGYALVVDPDSVDALRFEALAREGRGLIDTDPRAASLVLSEALALWRGHAYEEFTYEAFAEAEIARLTELRLTTVEDRIAADLAAGRCHDLVPELEALVRQHPERERLTSQLMLALHQSGRQGEALRAYAAYRDHLVRELGLDPSEAIARLEQRILADDPTLRPSTPIQPASGAAPGLTIRGYELRELIGSGATGHVFTAFQPAVGREVAIKVVRPEMANDPDFIRRFEAEARRVAGLEHPGIVPVYDYWREAGGAYLVMRRFEGGNLRTVLEHRAVLTADARHRIVEQVGGALAAAHERGVTHGDLRPANVLIDDHGDAYLADFGLSYDITTSERGSADFLAPEQIATGVPSLASDVFALGKLTGLVLGDDVDPRVGDVIDRACRPDPGDRFADAGAFVAAFDAATGRLPPTVDRSRAVNPYRGLQAFHESDASVFFGRERLIERLLARIGAAGTSGRFVAVVGPSGSGKSSVVRAGLVPALRRGAVPGSERWFISTVVPGRHPFASLADALRAIAVGPADDLVEQLRTIGIAPVVRRLLADEAAQVVIVIDQLEELFVQSDPVESDVFLAAVAAAVTDRRSVVRIVATLRADFYGAPLEHPAFGELVRLGTDAITPLEPGELERAITGPATQVGVTVEPGVVAAIAADMVGQPTALPLMQFALTELYERHTGASITVSDYHELGGLTRALALRADSVLDGLHPALRAEARHVFLRLVTLIDGAADTRRRARLSELTSSAHADLTPLLDAFVAHRLLSLDLDPITRGPTVEIAHEALLSEWTTLRDWIDDARGDVRLHRRLAEEAAEWRTHDHNADFLLTGEQLATYAGWHDDPPVHLTGDERAFLDASRDHSEAELVIERRRTRRLRRLVVGVAAALVVALVAGALAYRQSRRADQEARRATDAADLAEEQASIADEQRAIAETQTVAAQEQASIAEAQTLAATESALLADVERMRAQAAAEVSRNPPLAALLAVEAYRLDASPLSAGAIQQVLTGVDGRQATLFEARGDYGGRNVMSSDGSLIAVTSSGTVDVWDVDERALLVRVDAELADFDMSVDGSLLAVDGLGTTQVDLIDVATGDVVGSIDRQVCRVIRFSPGGDRLATLVNETDRQFGCDQAAPRRLQIYDITDPAAPVLAYTDTVADVADVWWTPDGNGYVTFDTGGSVELRDAVTNEPSWTYVFDRSSGIGQGSLVNPIGALFRTDGRAVVVAVQFNDVSGIWLFTFDALTGEVTREPTSTAGLGSMNWWDEEETQVVGTLWPSGATVLDLDRAEEVLPPPVVNPNATAVYVDREHERIVEPGFVGIEIFSLDGTSVLERRISLTPEQLAVKAESDGQLFASMSADGTRLLMSVLDFQNRSRIVEWDLTTDPPTEVGDLGPGITFAQGHSTIVFDFESVRILDGDFEQIGRAALPEFERGQPYAWRASADGSRHAPQRAGTPVIDVYDTESGERIAELMPPGVAPDEIALADVYSFSADGELLLANYLAADGAFWVVYETSTGDVVRTGTSEIIGLPWLDGTTIYSNPPESFDVERRDVVTAEVVGPPLVGHTLILNAIVDDLGSDRIVTQATNGNVRVWDRETGDQIGREIAIGRQSSGTGVATARGGDLVGVILDTEFAIWDYDVDGWPGLACQLAGRNMTRSEWDDFGPQGVEYRATCPQFPGTHG